MPNEKDCQLISWLGFSLQTLKNNVFYFGSPPMKKKWAERRNWKKRLAQKLIQINQKCFVKNFDLVVLCSILAEKIIGRDALQLDSAEVVRPSLNNWPDYNTFPDMQLLSRNRFLSVGVLLSHFFRERAPIEDRNAGETQPFACAFKLVIIQVPSLVRLVCAVRGGNEDVEYPEPRPVTLLCHGTIRQILNTGTKHLAKHENGPLCYKRMDGLTQSARENKSWGNQLTFKVGLEVILHGLHDAVLLGDADIGGGPLIIRLDANRDSLASQSLGRDNEPAVLCMGVCLGHYSNLTPGTMDLLGEDDLLALRQHAVVLLNVLNIVPHRPLIPGTVRASRPELPVACGDKRLPLGHLQIHLDILQRTGGVSPVWGKPNRLLKPVPQPSRLQPGPRLPERALL